MSRTPCGWKPTKSTGRSHSVAFNFKGTKSFEVAFNGSLLTLKELRVSDSLLTGRF